MAKQKQEQQWISAFQQGGSELERAMLEVYQDAVLWQQIEQFVRRMGGSREDAEDIFQDGIRVLILRVRQTEKGIEGALRPYLVGICRKLWFKKYSRDQREVNYQESLTMEPEITLGPEQQFLREEVQKQVQLLLDKLKSPCREILILWQLGYSMKEIAAATKYKSEGVVRKKKHQCMQQLLTILAREPAWKQWFDQ